MIGIYLACCKARHPNYHIVYQDIEQVKYNCDLGGDMLDIDLSDYDFIIASPPCNYYSRANYRREISSYSQATKHLLPCILEKLGQQNKPFIVENVRSPRLFDIAGINAICNKYGIFEYVIGRHIYWTNIMCNLSCKQEFDFHSSIYAKTKGIKTERQNYRQGGDNVHNVIELWLDLIHWYNGIV